MRLRRVSHPSPMVLARPGKIKLLWAPKKASLLVTTRAPLTTLHTSTKPAGGIEDAEGDDDDDAAEDEDESALRFLLASTNAFQSGFTVPCTRNLATPPSGNILNLTCVN